jgi:hypothetical protein
VQSPEPTPTTLRALRRSRRRHYLSEGDWVESLYRAYIVAIVAALVLFYGTVALGGSVDPAAARDVREHGAAVLGLGLAVLVWMGLRSGARGGPLAPEPADVAHLLLAPVSRGEVLRSTALRQLRGVVLVPAVIGATAGNVAAGRLGGDRAEWLLAGAAFGTLASLAVWGAALVASSAHLRARAANGLGAVIVLWSGVDVVAGHVTAPSAQIARVALWPLASSALVAVGIALPVALVAVALARVGRISLEPLRHRAQLIGELRYAATLQDMRSVIVLHRELAQELPRATPWWRGRTEAGGPVWQRDWRGLARWPVGRIVRVLALAVAVVLAVVGVWHGVEGLVVLAGAALFLVGVDAVEGLAQETDHPERPAQYPRLWGDLVVGHLLAPGVVLLGLMVVVAAAVGVVTADGSALAVAAVAVVPAALAAVVGAALSVVAGAPPPTLYLDFGFPELTNLWLILRQVLGPLLVVTAFVPLAVGYDAWTNDRSAVGAALGMVALPILLVVGAALWLRSRTAVVR